MKQNNRVHAVCVGPEPANEVNACMVRVPGVTMRAA
jgi:hypothetical protein